MQHSSAPQKLANSVHLADWQKQRAVYVCSHHPLVAKAIFHTLSARYPHLTVRPFTEFKEFQPKTIPPILILDPLTTSGWQNLLRSWHLWGGRSVVLMPLQAGSDYLMRVLSLGAHALVKMSGDFDQELIKALQNVCQRGMWMRCELLDNSPKIDFPLRQLSNQAQRLTGREGEVFGHLVCGERNKQIATALGISERTVKFHVSNILQKMCLRSRKTLLCKSVVSTFPWMEYWNSGRDSVPPLVGG